MLDGACNRCGLGSQWCGRENCKGLTKVNEACYSRQTILEHPPVLVQWAPSASGVRDIMSEVDDGTGLVGSKRDLRSQHGAQLVDGSTHAGGENGSEDLLCT